MNNIEIITTSDGSHSLLNKELNETYHSHHGAVQESLHVFIKQGLEFYLKRAAAKSVAIFEVGFGTGLNALLSQQHIEYLEGVGLIYTSVEAFPLQKDVWSQLNYACDPAAREKFKALHEAQWDCLVELQPNFKLLKHHATLQNLAIGPSQYDLIYFDAFAPNKQPAMWEMPLLQKIVDSMLPEGVFVTYCAKGQLKRDLKALGLQVETLAGPPGKKEMVRGLKI